MKDEPHRGRFLRVDPEKCRERGETAGHLAEEVAAQAL
jgi:hypothetical protein